MCEHRGEGERTWCEHRGEGETGCWENVPDVPMLSQVVQVGVHPEGWGRQANLC